MTNTKLSDISKLWEKGNHKRYYLNDYAFEKVLKDAGFIDSSSYDYKYEGSVLSSGYKKLIQRYSGYYDAIKKEFVFGSADSGSKRDFMESVSKDFISCVEIDVDDKIEVREKTDSEKLIEKIYKQENMKKTDTNIFSDIQDIELKENTFLVEIKNDFFKIFCKTKENAKKVYCGLENIDYSDMLVKPSIDSDIFVYGDKKLIDIDEAGFYEFTFIEDNIFVLFGCIETLIVSEKTKIKHLTNNAI